MQHRLADLLITLITRKKIPREMIAKRLLLISLILVAVAASFGWAIRHLYSGRGSAGKPATMTIGTAPLESSALVYVAQRKGFFDESGLSVTIKDYDTGAAALEGVLKGEVDVAIPAEYAVVGKAFQKKDVCALASIAKSQYFYLIGRRDKGIGDVADLKGKKIGVVTRTTAEFYLGRFLDLHGMNTDQVHVVHIDIPHSENAIADGRVDAIVSRPPYAGAIERRLGMNAVTWAAQSSQALYAVMIGRGAWVKDHPEPVKRMLGSLVRAEEYAIRYPAEAKGIVKERLQFDDAYMTAVWSQNQFSLSLDQSLVTAMEDEARWMIRSGLTVERQVPDFLDYLCEGGLKAVKPEAVNIIR